MLPGFGILDEPSQSLPNSPKGGRSRTRSRPRPPLTMQSNVVGSPCPSPQPLRKRDSTFYRSTSLETRSRSPSPTNTTSSQTPIQEYYGTANLTDRSRSPSPVASSPPKKQARRLPMPPKPPKPSSLNLAQPKLKENMPRVLPSPTIPQPPKSPGSINFPRLNKSPSHVPKHNIPPNRPVPAPAPGRVKRPEPYSPTERNNLNKVTNVPVNRTHMSHTPPPPHIIGSSQIPRPRIPHSSPHMSPHLSRTNSRDRDGDPHERYRTNSHSPDINRNDTYERTNFLGNQPTPLNVGRFSPRNASTLPNGFKPKGRKRTDKLEMRSDSNIPLHTNNSEDESDWC